MDVSAALTHDACAAILQRKPVVGCCCCLWSIPCGGGGSGVGEDVDGVFVGKDTVSCSGRAAVKMAAALPSRGLSYYAVFKGDL